MDEDDCIPRFESESTIVKIMDIESLRLYKCPKVYNNVDGRVLFIFKLLDTERMGRPGSFTNRRPKYTHLSLDSTFLYNLDDDRFSRTIYQVSSVADLFFNSETDEQLASTLTRLIRSYYRFNPGILSAFSDYSLVFVVEVGRSYATKGYIEATERMLSDYHSTRRRESSDKDEPSAVDANVVNDKVDDCDCRSIIMDDGFDDDLEEEEEEEEIDWEKEEEMNNIMNEVRSWQELPNDFEPVLEEINPLITYEDLNWDIIGNDYVITKEEEKRGECAICLSPYTGKVRNDPVFTWEQETNCYTLVILGCGHSFHHRCIFKWLEQNQNCPLCRSVTYVTV